MLLELLHADQELMVPEPEVFAHQEHALPVPDLPLLVLSLQTAPTLLPITALKVPPLEPLTTAHPLFVPPLLPLPPHSPPFATHGRTVTSLELVLAFKSLVMPPLLAPLKSADLMDSAPLVTPPLAQELNAPPPLMMTPGTLAEVTVSAS